MCPQCHRIVTSVSFEVLGRRKPRCADLGLDQDLHIPMFPHSGCGGWTRSDGLSNRVAWTHLLRHPIPAASTVGAVPASPRAGGVCTNRIRADLGRLIRILLRFIRVEFGHALSRTKRELRISVDKQFDGIHVQSESELNVALSQHTVLFCFAHFLCQWIFVLRRQSSPRTSRSGVSLQRALLF